MPVLTPAARQVRSATALAPTGDDATVSCIEGQQHGPIQLARVELVHDNNLVPGYWAGCSGKIISKSAYGVILYAGVEIVYTAGNRRIKGSVPACRIREGRELCAAAEPEN